MQTIDQVWMPPTLPVHTDEQTIDQVWVPPALPVLTDEQTVFALRANFAWDKRIFIGFQRQRAAGLRLARDGASPAAAGLRLALEPFDASARCWPPREAFPSDLPTTQKIRKQRWLMEW